MEEKVIVIGAGAAGLMAAGTAAERGFDVFSLLYIICTFLL